MSIKRASTSLLLGIFSKLAWSTNSLTALLENLLLAPQNQQVSHHSVAQHIV